jgi:thiol-disulfide isomerase/thioredoxin
LKEAEQEFTILIKSEITWFKLSLPSNPGMICKPSLIISKAKYLPEGLSWLNIDRPLSLEDLKGQVVILDFWTYRCINCMYTLLDLDWIEK